MLRIGKLVLNSHGIFDSTSNALPKVLLLVFHYNLFCYYLLQLRLIGKIHLDVYNPIVGLKLGLFELMLNTSTIVGSSGSIVFSDNFEKRSLNLVCLHLN
jgi:hypothetical protein